MPYLTSQTLRQEDAFGEAGDDRQEVCKCSRPDVLDLVDGPCCIGCGFPVARTLFQNPSHSSTGYDYNYKRLWISDEIRLVRLLPSARRADDIQCVITHTTLSQNLRFEALSYVWGSNVLSHKVYTSEGVVRVTGNCMEAMRDLRSPSDDRLLWIDAICINQTSNEEKNHQVPLMSKIYAAAYQVIIYLGPDNHDEASGIFRWLKNEQDKMDFKSLVAIKHIYKQMNIILGKPWFSRVWVLQEVSNSKKTLLAWGPNSTDWVQFSVALTKRLSEWDRSRSMDNSHIPPTLFLANSEPRPFKNLYTLVHYARNTRSSDPRDKVYALIGLLDNSVEHSIVPDYNKSVEQVYADLVQSFINIYNHLDVLLFCSDVPKKGNSASRDPRIFETSELEPVHQLATWLPKLTFNPKIRSPKFFPERRTPQYDIFNGRVARLCDSKEHRHTGLALEVCLLRYRTVEKHFERLEAKHTPSGLPKDLVWLYLSGKILPGDEVCFINGTTEPYVLRQVRTEHDSLEFRIVTDCNGLFVDMLKHGHDSSAMEMNRPIIRDWESGEVLPWELACLV
ncbi:HET-domain-containing protein [Periconia macrospinosa]|uniref:HET-domain-containing protein n=1 Tax=Periconia macrospinosa TaxID=97972 RepID=A0A2V1DV66_9PLEO|nr:HET-domain-containing protein [Periconia macrospinosa]